MTLLMRSWPISAAKGKIVLIHGTAEHSGRYEHVATFLNECGYSVYAGDLPGWGESPGLKGHVDSFAQYLEAVAAWVQRVREGTVGAETPLYLLGHSLGGLIAIRFLQQLEHPDQLRGVILSSPCLQLRLPLPPWLVKAAETLNRLWPRLRVPNQIAAWMVTRNENVRQQYLADPLVYNKVSIRWFCELQKAMRAARADADKVRVPLLVMQAGDDQLVDPAATADFVQRVQTADKTFHLFPGLYHEVLNEPERDQVLTVIREWLQRRETAPGK